MKGDYQEIYEIWLNLEDYPEDSEVSELYDTVYSYKAAKDAFHELKYTDDYFGDEVSIVDLSRDENDVLLHSDVIESVGPRQRIYIRWAVRFEVEDKEVLEMGHSFEAGNHEPPIDAERAIKFSKDTNGEWVESYIYEAVTEDGVEEYAV